jgi:hypothetical protein
MPRKIDDAYFAGVKARLPTVENAACMRKRNPARDAVVTGR